MKNEINPYFKLYGLIDNDFKKNFMQMLYIVLIMAFCISFSSSPGYSQQVGGVGINTTVPDVSAVLDIVSDDKGLLIPRLTQGQVDTAITLPATGLMVFNTTTNSFQFNSGTPGNPVWGNVGGGSGKSWSTGGNTGTSPTANFIGTGDNADLSIRVDSAEMIRITTSGFVGIKNSSPVEALDVDGGIKIGNTSSTNEGTLRWTGSDLEVYDGQNSWLSLTVGGGDNDWTVSGNYVYNLSDSIGIGTSAPSHLLNVVGGGNAITGSSVDVSELSTVLRSTSNVSSEAVGIGFGHSGSAANVGAAIIHERTGSNSQGNLHFATKASTSPGVDIPIRMTITKDGNVGIGTTAPNANYHTEIATTSLARNLLLNNDYGGSLTQFAVVADMSNSGTGTKFGYYVQGEDYNYFSGNVGVGTTAPINKVDVEGAAVIGATYSGTNTAPANGLLVEGGVGFGITSPLTEFHYNHTSGIANGMAISNTIDSDRWHWYVYSANNLQLYFNGTLRGTFDYITGDYSSLSDRSLKTDITSMNNVLDDVLKLDLKAYKYKHQEDETKHIGFIAQDVNKVFPSLVDYQDEDDLFFLNYTGFGALSIGAIQELNKKHEEEIVKLYQAIEDLQKQVDELKNQ
jgi:hypothetical protein